MPDWSYMTVFRPVLFQLPAERARDLALRAMSTLARLPGGGLVIDLLGHMHPDPRLARDLLGSSFPSPIGLGPGLDVNCVALPALARFGFGFIEIGPITAAATSGSVSRDADREAVVVSAPAPNPGAAALLDRLAQMKRLAVPIVVRLASSPDMPVSKSTEEVCRMATDLRPYVAVFSLATRPQAAPETWRDHVTTIVQAAAPRPVLLVLPADFEDAAAPLQTALEAGVRGVIVDGSVGDAGGGRVFGTPARAAALARVKWMREQFGNDLVIVAGGGIHEPVHAHEFLAAGANLIQTDTGLIFSGPGLPKRINEAILASGVIAPSPPT